MRLEVVSTIAELDALRDEWQDLELRDPTATFYVTHGFVRAWWSAYQDAPGHALRVVLWREGGRLVGLAPMSVRPAVSNGQTVSELRWASHGDYLTVLTDPTHTDSVLRSFLGWLQQPDEWHSVNLAGIPGDGPLAHHLLKSPLNRNFTYYVESPYIDLTPFDSFDAFARDRLPSHTRKYRNKLYRETGVTFRTFRGDEEGILDRLASVHRAEKAFLVERKDRSERHSLFEDERRFAHVRAAYADGDAVTFAYVDPTDRVIGYRTAYAHRRTYLSWNSAYLPEYERYRIGKVIQYDILEHLFRQQDADVFDLGAGRYPWKFEWTPAYRVTYRLRLRLAGPDAPPKPGTGKSGAARTGERRTRTDQPPTPVTRGARPTSSWRRLARRARLPGARRRVEAALSAAGKPLRPPVIWYVPHPDDETIFMGGSIARTRHRRNILVVLTRGGGSTAVRKVSERLGREVTLEEFMTARLAELRAATAALGVRRSDVIQHDLPDGAVTEADVLKIITSMAARHPRAAHRTLSYVDPHPDHRTTGRALRRAYDEGVVDDVQFFLPVPIMAAREFPRAPLGVRDVAAKRAALAEYQQWAPEQGRYAIGATSVRRIIDKQLAKPTERVHGPDHPLPRQG